MDLGSRRTADGTIPRARAYVRHLLRREVQSVPPCGMHVRCGAYQVGRAGRLAAAKLCGGAVGRSIVDLLARADASGAPPAVWVADDELHEATHPARL
jgi:hypothetical protein